MGSGVKKTRTAENAKVQLIKEQLDSEDNYQEFIKSSLDGIITLNIKGFVLSVNEAFCRITGFSSDEMIGKHLSLLPTLYKRDIPRYVKLFASMIVGLKITGSVEFNWIHKNGSQQAGEFYYLLKRTQGKISAVCIVARDVSDAQRIATDLEKAIQIWQATFDSIGEAVCIMDTEGKIRQCNKTMARLASKEKDKMINHTPCQYLHGQTGHIKDCPWQRMLSSKRRERAELKVGNTVMEVSVDPILDRDKKLIGAVHIVADITARKQMDRKISRYQKQLQNLSKMLQSSREEERKYISRIIHDEFGQTLTALKMDLSLLRRKISPEQQELIQNLRWLRLIGDVTFSIGMIGIGVFIARLTTGGSIEGVRKD
jgi:two-component system sensor histidine kinase UhpB